MMTMRVRPVALLLFVLVALHRAPWASAQAEEEIPRLVLVFSWDGLRPDAIEKAPAANLLRLIREGAYCPTAQTIFPSATLPSHTSMLTGLSVAKHKVVWNNYIPLLRIGHPTFLDVATEAGMECAMAAGKEKLYYFFEGHRVGTYLGEKPDGEGSWRALSLVGSVIEHLRTKRPRAMFVHFRDPDSSGHEHGWMSPEQMAAIRDCDEALGRVLALLEEDAEYRGRTTVLVSADHGGHDRTHGSPSRVDMTVPWVVWGFGAARGKVLRETVRTYDTAATVLYLLGLEVPTNWDGKPALTALFDPQRR